MPRQSSAINAAQRVATNMKRIVGENIKTHRLARDLSQEELAEKFGVSRATVSQYEIGVGEVNAGDLPRLAEILGVSLDQFFLDQFFQQPPEASIVPSKPDTARMLAQIARQTGGDRALNPLPNRLQDAKGIRLPQVVETAQSPSMLLAQFSKLSEDNQEAVRRIVSALYEKQSPVQRRVGAKRVTRRPQKKGIE